MVLQNGPAFSSDPSGQWTAHRGFKCSMSHWTGAFSIFLFGIYWKMPFVFCFHYLPSHHKSWCSMNELLRSHFLFICALYSLMWPVFRTLLELTCQNTAACVTLLRRSKYAGGWTLHLRFHLRDHVQSREENLWGDDKEDADCDVERIITRH